MMVRRFIPLALLPLAVSVFGAASGTVASSPVAASPSSAGGLMQVLFGLVVVLALLAGCAWLLRRVSSSRSLGGANIKIIGGVSVGTRERVIVVEVADQWIVVGVAPGRINALSTMPKQQADAPHIDTPLPRNFSNWLAHTLEKRNAQ
jgi:flagellar protein FliO/FliZ